MDEERAAAANAACAADDEEEYRVEMREGSEEVAGIEGIPSPSSPAADEFAKVPLPGCAMSVDSGNDGTYWPTKELLGRRRIFGGRPRGRGPEETPKRRFLPVSVLLLEEVIMYTTRSPVTSATMSPCRPCVMPWRSACTSASGR